MQASGQTSATEGAETEVPPGTEDEKPAEEVKPKKEPQVCIFPECDAAKFKLFRN